MITGINRARVNGLIATGSTHATNGCTLQLFGAHLNNTKYIKLNESLKVIS